MSNTATHIIPECERRTDTCAMGGERGEEKSGKKWHIEDTNVERERGIERVGGGGNRILW